MNIFISCVSKKRDIPCKAEEMYISSLFKKSLSYAKTLNGHIRILSAKYGVLELDDFIEPYELTLNSMSEMEKKTWAEKVITQLNQKNIDFNEFTVFLVGENYRKYLISFFPKKEIPLEGLPIGKQLEWYTKQLNEKHLSSVKNILW